MCRTLGFVGGGKALTVMTSSGSGHAIGLGQGIGLGSGDNGNGNGNGEHISYENLIFHWLTLRF